MRDTSSGIIMMGPLTPHEAIYDEVRASNSNLLPLYLQAHREVTRQPPSSPEYSVSSIPMADVFDIALFTGLALFESMIAPLPAAHVMIGAGWFLLF